jgi:hypothetical protein
MCKSTTKLKFKFEIQKEERKIKRKRKKKKRKKWRLIQFLAIGPSSSFAAAQLLLLAPTGGA